MSGWLIWHSRNLTTIADKTYGDANDVSFSGNNVGSRVCKRPAAHWIRSYPVAEFGSTRSDKLGLPDYPTSYISAFLQSIDVLNKREDTGAHIGLRVVIHVSIVFGCPDTVIVSPNGHIA